MTSTTRTATPEAIVDIAIGFMGAQQLFAASRIGLFAALADGPLDVHGLAAATGREQRQVRILADSMAAQGLLGRADGRYTLAEDAAAYLTGADAELDVAPFLAFLAEISYPQWSQYANTVDTDQPGTLDLDEAGWGRFMNGVMNYNEVHAAMLVRNFDFSGFRDVLDLGGLSPAFSVNAMKANPGLRTRFVFAPDFTDSVRAAVESAGVADRSIVEGGDTETVEPGGEHDLVMVNHVIHRFDDAQNREILAHARAAAAPGATLIVLDFFLDDDAEQRTIDALHAGEYFNIDGTIVYPESVVREWLAGAGWEPQDVIALPGSPRILVAKAV